jgi:hypothetical protein
VVILFIISVNILLALRENERIYKEFVQNDYKITQTPIPPPNTSRAPSQQHILKLMLKQNTTVDENKIPVQSNTTAESGIPIQSNVPTEAETTQTNEDPGVFNAPPDTVIIQENVVV